LTAGGGAADDEAVRGLRLLLLSACAAGCRTPPYQLEDLATPAPRDLALSDQASLPDLARQFDLLAPDDCPPEAKLVYLVDARNALLSAFRPDTLSFRDVAVLSCGTGPGYSPDSMAVQRDGTAWVEWTDSSLMNAELHNVDLMTGACDPTPHFLPGNAPTSFGMAFTIDNGLDTLYVMGPTAQMQGGSDVTFGLLSLDVSFRPIGTLPADGDLSGSSDGHVYAFLPNWSGLGSQVVDVDKTDGAALQTWKLPQLDSDLGDVAIAGWGGQLWVFVGQGSNDGTTAVFDLDPVTGGLTTAIADTGRHVVGAGVAPCKNVGGD
jgi:sugar lactone lactonase YvrE